MCIADWRHSWLPVERVHFTVVENPFVMPRLGAVSPCLVLSEFAARRREGPKMSIRPGRTSHLQCNAIGHVQLLRQQPHPGGNINPYNNGYRNDGKRDGAGDNVKRNT